MQWNGYDRMITWAIVYLLTHTASNGEGVGALLVFAMLVDAMMVISISVAFGGGFR